VKSPRTVENASFWAEFVEEGVGFCSVPTLVPRNSPVPMNEDLILGASYQEAFAKITDYMLCNPALTAYLAGDAQDPFPQLTTTGATARNETEDVLATSSTNEQLPAHEMEWLNSDVVSRTSSSPDSQSAAVPKPETTQADLPSSLGMPSYGSSLYSQDIQLPCAPVVKYPSRKYETVKYHETGKIFPAPYLSQIRALVDPTFANDNWGDEYYFSGAMNFKHLEDFRRDPYHETDQEAGHQGLDRRAMAIPLRTMKDSMQSFGEALNKLGSGDGMGSIAPGTVEEIQQCIQQCLPREPPQLPRDLEPRIQQQKIIDSRRAKREIDVRLLAAPNSLPFRLGTAPFVAGNIRQNGQVTKFTEEVGQLEQEG
jgi:hypothetical protein